MKASELEEMVTKLRVSERDAIEETAQAAINAVRSFGNLSIMANGALPLTGRLLYVHPKVYERVRELAQVHYEGKADD